MKRGEGVVYEENDRERVRFRVRERIELTSSLVHFTAKAFLPDPRLFAEDSFVVASEAAADGGFFEGDGVARVEDGEDRDDGAALGVGLEACLEGAAAPSPGATTVFAFAAVALDA